MRKIATIGALLLLTASTASAQSSAWGQNGYISFAGMFQTTSTTFGDALDVIINQEPVTLNTDHEVSSGPAFDVTAGGRIVGNLGVGFGFTYFRRDAATLVDGGIPHPFFFNQPRGLSGEGPGLRHEERAVHVHAMYLMPLTESFQVAVFGGPSYFQVRQAMVSAVEYHDEYPYDAVSFTSVKSEQTKASRYGYNAGVDVSFFMSRYVGVGMLVRYSRSELDLPSPDGGTTDVEAGGMQGGAGIRFRF